MDKRSLVIKLNQLFCDTNRKDKRYSKIWLSEVDFGGIYFSNDKFILNVVAEHDIDNCNNEIREIISLLDKRAKDELQSIWRVIVYNSREQWHCESDDLLVYSKEDACNT
jgi:hypothetical protein